ncbi:MAG: magnesium and cobalt transport protein CorA, partial [Thermotogaceae bacterium]|nr:magnesium and cobalt transport protein CorA [Thermotogaceae bacterium]
LREVLYECRNRDNPMIGATTKTYFKDVYDHCIHVLDTLEIMKDLLSEMTELFLTRSSNRTNETMKFLTIISTIFMPLSFIAGVYGMNFLAMPELKWEYGYPVILGAMGGITLLMIFLFKRKRWF